MPIAKSKLNQMVDLWDNQKLTYDEELKTIAHQLAIRWLRHLATNVFNCEKGDYVVRSNKAGIAVSGEVTLHINRVPNYPLGLYIQICQYSSGQAVLYRTCNNLADYVGHTNHFASLREAVDDPKLFFKILPQKVTV